MVQEVTKFDTVINIIGSIPDYRLLYFALGIASKGDAEALKQALLDKNEFDFRTEQARERFLRGLKSTFLKFENEGHQNLIHSLFQEENLVQTKNLALFWQMSINNALCFDLSREMFLKLYFSGRSHFPKNEIAAYLIHLKDHHEELKSWSDKTTDIVASKYLLFLKKLNLLKGDQKKEFVHINLDKTSFVFFVYLLSALYPNAPDILETELFEFAFMSKEIFHERAKRAENLEYFNYRYDGVNLRLEPKFKPEEIIHVLCNRT